MLRALVPDDGVGLEGADDGPAVLSRRITKEDRLVYRVAGKGDAQALEIAQVRFHY